MSSKKCRRRIAIVTTVSETIESILQGQPQFLSNHFDVTLINGDQVRGQIAATREGVAFKFVPMVRGINVLHDVYSIVRMIFALREIKPDMVHSYTPKAGLIAMLASWVCRTPVRTHTFTGLIFPSASGIRQKILMAVDRLICACATLVVPEGLGVKRDLIAFGITDKPLNVIGHGNIAGVDTSYFSSDIAEVRRAAASLRECLGLDESVFVFCYIGRLNRDKGLSELVGAFSRLGAKAHLLLVGEIDRTAPVSDEVLSAIEKNPRIHALGFLSDIRPALASSDVLVLASYREGFPNVVLQAGSMKRPAIVTDINGCNEIIESDWNGWLVPVRREQALSEAMVKAMALSVQRRTEMGERARARVQARFERRTHWRRVVDFYSALLLVDRQS